MKSSSDSQIRYASDKQLAIRYGVSRPTIWRWSTQDILPKPIRFSDCCTRWDLNEIERRDAEHAGRKS